VQPNIAAIAPSETATTHLRQARDAAVSDSGRDDDGWHFPALLVLSWLPQFWPDHRQSGTVAMNGIPRLTSILPIRRHLGEAADALIEVVPQTISPQFLAVRRGWRRNLRDIAIKEGISSAG
jgi:hypothetical protein